MIGSPTKLQKSIDFDFTKWYNHKKTSNEVTKMINLPNIFSDKALYLHSSVLNIRGNAEKCEKITVSLIKNNEIIGEWSGMSDENGGFTVTIETPAASYDTYKISVKATNDERL